MDIEKLLAFVVGPVLLVIAISLMVLIGKPEKKEAPINMDILSEKHKDLFEEQKETIAQLNNDIVDLKSQFLNKDTVIDSLTKILSQKELYLSFLSYHSSCRTHIKFSLIKALEGC